MPGRSSFAAAVLAFALIFIAAPESAGAEPAPDYKAQRRVLVKTIEAHARFLRAQTGLAPPTKKLLNIMGKVPRHLFVPKPLRPYAYLDRPLPIGHGQNIAQPYIVALMTDLARIGPNDVVFETGTGAGYHAAILSLLAKRVYSVEVIEPLARSAARRLARLGYRNVETRAGDGYFGWPEKGPYDVIIIKEAVDHIPPALLKQLKPGGRMVLPLGPLSRTQQLTLVEKSKDGRIKKTEILPVRFSPFQGGERI